MRAPIPCVCPCGYSFSTILDECPPLCSNCKAKSGETYEQEHFRLLAEQEEREAEEKREMEAERWRLRRRTA